MQYSDLNPSFRHLIGLMWRSFGHVPPVSLQPDKAAQNPDYWDQLSKYAFFHGVVPWLRHRLGESELRLPADTQLRWREHASRNFDRSLRNWTGTVTLLSTLKTAGVAALPLKGVATAVRYYGNAGLRVSSDIDILVSVDSITQASAIVRGLGFQPVEPLGELGDAQRAWYLRNRHHFVFVHRGDSLRLELHWALHDAPLLGGQDRRWMRDPAQPMLNDSMQLPGLDNVTDYLMLMSHGLRSQWQRMKWLLDAHIAWSQLSESDKTAATRRLQALRLGKAQQRVLELASATFGVGEPKSSRVPRGIWALNNGLGLSRSSLFGRVALVWDFVSARPSAAYAWHALKSVAVDPADWALVPLPNALFFLYGPLRIPLWFYRRWRPAPNTALG